MPDRETARRNGIRNLLSMARAHSVFTNVIWATLLVAFLLFAGIGNRSWPMVLIAVVLIAVMYPWILETFRLRIADHAFVIDGELYIDAGSEQLILSPEAVRLVGILSANSLEPTGFQLNTGSFVGIDLVHPESGKLRRYVAPLEDGILLRRLRSAGFNVSAKRID